MVIPFNLHQTLEEIPNKTLVNTAPNGLSMYRFDAPETLNTLGQIPERVFLYYYHEKLVTVFVKLAQQVNDKALLQKLEDTISDALHFLPEALSADISEGFKWETDIEVLTLLYPSGNNPISLYLADKNHSVF